MQLPTHLAAHFVAVEPDCFIAHLQYVLVFDVQPLKRSSDTSPVARAVIMVILAAGSALRSRRGSRPPPAGWPPVALACSSRDIKGSFYWTSVSQSQNEVRPGETNETARAN